jgi:acetyltransferase-like isoleucine patch superfamily enzyme
MRPIIFIGYKGDLGTITEICNLTGREIRGIMDGNFMHVLELDGIPFLGDEESLRDTQRHLLDECDFIITSGFAGVKNADDPDRSGDLLRIKQINLLKEVKACLATLIHPAAIVSKSAVIGEGSIVQPLAVVGPDAVIGAHSQLHAASAVAHHSVIGENFNCGPRAFVGGNTRIGDNVYMGAWSSIFEGHWKNPVTVGDNSMIQLGVICMVNIPENTTVGIHGKMFKRYESPALPDIIVTRSARGAGH